MRPPLTGSGGRADDVGRRRGGFRGGRAGGEIADDVGRRRGGFRGGRAGGGRAGGEIAGDEIADDVGRRRGGFRGGRAGGGRAGGEIADDVGRRRGGFRGGRAGGEIAGGEIAGGEIVSCEIADDVGRRRGGFRGGRAGGEIAGGGRAGDVGRGRGGFRGGRAGGEIAGGEIVSCEIADGDGGRGRAFSNRRRCRRGRKGVGKVLVEPFHEGVFIAKGTEGAIIPGKSQEGLVTKNLVPGEAVYKEKKIYVQNEDGTKVEYRVWDPCCSKLAAAIIGGLENLWIKPGAKVLYLGAGSGYTVSHVSDLVGPEGCVYAVEMSHRSGRELVNMAEKRTNVTPVIEDARHPAKYGMLVGMVDVILSDVDQPDQVRILALNASHFLKSGGHFLCSIKANCINSTLPAEALFQKELEMLKLEQLKPSELLLLEPLFKRNALVVGGYRMPKKKTVTVIGA